MIDLAIVGAGPAGLHTATTCAAAGLEVVVFEEHATIGHPAHCTGIVSMETANLAKIPDEIVLARVTSAHMRSPGGRCASLQWEDFSDDQILAIDRAAFDAELASAAATAGATVRTHARVDEISVGPDGVDLSIRHERIRARVCVLACGVAYRFQRQLGLGLPGQIVHTAQVEVDAGPVEAVELYFGRDVAPEGFIWSVPVVRDGRSRLKIGAMARGDAARHLQAFLDRRGVREQLTEPPGKPVRRLLPLRPIPKTYSDRVLAVGDAGGFTKPTTGGGIFYSLLTATRAAETLAEAFGAGRFDGAFLGRYETRWQADLGQELRVADWLRGVVSKCTDRDMDELVDAMASDDVKAVIARTARFNWHRDFILAMVRQRGIKSLLFRLLFR